MQLNEKLEALTDSLKEYASTNYELIKLEIIDHSSDIISGLISAAIIGITLLLFLLFGSIYVAYYLSNLLEIEHIGFAVVGVFYLLVAIIIHLNKKSLIESRVCDNFIKRKMAKKSS